MAKLIKKEPSHTLAELLLEPQYQPADLTPDAVSHRTPLSRFRKGEEPHFNLNIPLTSAIMQAVTDHILAISLAFEGGLGFIYDSQPILTQADMVAEVKNHKAGYVKSRANLKPNATLQEAIDKMDRTGFSTIPITTNGGPHDKLLGVITDADIWRHKHPMGAPVSEYMTPRSDLHVGDWGLSLTEANQRMRELRRKNLPLVDGQGRLKAIVFKKDYEQRKEFPLQLVDANKRLMVGAGINTWDYKERVPALLAAGVDALCFNSSNGFTEHQYKGVQYVRKLIDEHARRTNKRVIVGGGNGISRESFRHLADAGIDFFKTGIGGGSICITREQKQMGCGTATAVEDTTAERNRYFSEEELYIPIVADGGIVYDSQMGVALALNADALMLGRYFARFTESPSNIALRNEMFVKEYWGEGSERARNWRRYSESGPHTLKFPEGVDGYVPWRGSLSSNVRGTMDKLTDIMIMSGAYNIPDLHEKAVVRYVSQNTITEGGAHDLLGQDVVMEYRFAQWGLERNAA